MDVIFERTGARRYATVVAPIGEAPRRTDPAPGFDDQIPHDVVHYLVEAELGLTHGVYGRAAAGGGGFFPTGEGDPRERARARRRLKRRESSLSRADRGDMARSEQLAAWCDLAWRRRAGARTPEWAECEPVPPDDEAVVDRVVSRLDELAPLWRDLPIGGQLRFTWPGTTATVVGPGA